MSRCSAILSCLVEHHKYLQVFDADLAKSANDWRQGHSLNTAYSIFPFHYSAIQNRAVVSSTEVHASDLNGRVLEGGMLVKFQSPFTETYHMRFRQRRPSRVTSKVPVLQNQKVSGVPWHGETKKYKQSKASVMSTEVFNKIPIAKYELHAATEPSHDALCLCN